jgi:hypothetical protein
MPRKEGRQAFRNPVLGPEDGERAIREPLVSSEMVAEVPLTGYSRCRFASGGSRFMNIAGIRSDLGHTRLAGLLACGLAVVVPPAVAGGTDWSGPLENRDPIPVVSSSSAAAEALERARQAGQGLVADLTLGQEGRLVRAASAEPLAPGRYRLHALVARTPHDHILAEAVALRLGAGASVSVFDAPGRFPDDGALTSVWLDVAVADRKILDVSVDWIVGDNKLDRQTYRDLGTARRVYLAQRQNAINQVSLRAGADAGLSASGASDLGDILDDLTAEERPRLRLQPLTGAALPAHRLVLGGLVLERMSPVEVTAVRTDAVALEPGGMVRGTAEIRNLATEPVTVTLAWTVEDDARPGEPLAGREETMTLAAGEQRNQALAEPLATAGIGRLGRMRVEAMVGSLRPDAARIPFVILPNREPSPPDRPRKVFAHYMGCYPAGTGVTRNAVLKAGEAMHHDRGDDVAQRGGRFRNFPLVPREPALTAEQSADLEIRRALRIGIDGFAVDAWAGGQGAEDVFDALIKVAEDRDYPFELTICLDNVGPAAVRSLLEKHGRSPKLARRDGKPLMFTYFSHGKALGTLAAEIDDRIPDGERQAAVNRLRATELGWHLIGQTFRKAEESIGQPVSFHYDLNYFFHEVPPDLVRPGMMTRAAAALAKHVSVLGSFGTYGFGYGDRTEDIARAVREAGAEWSGPGGMHQKENILPGGGEIFMPRGTERLRGVWADMIRDQASLLQLVTWNDYTENTNLAPAFNTRYTIYDLTGYFIDWWRRGEPPVPEQDRVYLTYAKYPRDARGWPFRIGVRSDRRLEVLTILTEPATVRLPGREIRYQAPAGLHVADFPVTPGPVSAEVVRDGAVVVRLESPEPITDRPFREDNAMVCFSTEFARHWKADFGDAPPLLYSEYGDADGDGLPNWFEMYWFTAERGFKPVASDDPDEFLEGPKEHRVTRWLDLSTATWIDPAADPDADGLSNLEEYRAGTDPTVPAPPAPAAARSSREN